MRVDKEITHELANRVLDLSVTISQDAHIFLGNNKDKSLHAFCRYPVSEVDALFAYPSSKEWREKTAFYNFSIPKYRLTDIPDSMTNYYAIFDGYQSDKIDIKQYSDFDSLVSWIDSIPELLTCFARGEKDSSCRFRLKTMIHEIVCRYLFVTKADERIPNDIEEQLKPIINEALLFYTAEQLKIDICIPICFLSFKENRILLSENVEIIKIDEDLQKSRQKACHYEVTNEDWIAACATHMIVLHNYYFNNDENLSVTAFHNYNSYPIKEIDKIMGIIRLATGKQSGYEQILCKPIGWMYDACADLPVIYGAKSHFVNSKELEKMWMFLTVHSVSSEQCNKIKRLYDSYKKNEEKLIFPLMRFNRCMMRNEIDDMSTDACIGLESLLAGGTKGEITYTISNRIPVVFSKNKSERYNSTNCRSIMKKIYNFRSKVVHGGTLKEKEQYITLGEDKIYVPDVAVDFLRSTLIFMIENPEYLEVSRIDEYIDKMIFNSADSSEE